MAQIWCPTKNIQENAQILSNEDLELALWSILQILSNKCKNELLYYMWCKEERTLHRMFVVFYGEMGVRGLPTQRYQASLVGCFQNQGGNELPSFITPELSASHRANMLRIAVQEHPEDTKYLDCFPEEAEMKPAALRAISLVYPKHARDGRDDAHGM
jgi:hypothetical protein